MTAVGNGWRGGMSGLTAGLSGFGVSVTVGRVMMGLRMYSFIDLSVNGLNYVHSVALSGAAFNPSWHLTAVGAGAYPVLRGSAIAGVKPRGATPLYGVHATSRRWLSFFR